MEYERVINMLEYLKEHIEARGKEDKLEEERILAKSKGIKDIL